MIVHNNQPLLNIFKTYFIFKTKTIFDWKIWSKNFVKMGVSYDNCVLRVKKKAI